MYIRGTQGQDEEYLLSRSKVISVTSLIIDGFISNLYNDKLSIPKRVPCKSSGRLYALNGHSDQLSVKNPNIYCF